MEKDKKINQKIIEEFTKLLEQAKYQADISKDKKEQVSNSFRIRQIKNVLDILKNYPKEITSGEDLKDVAGVGKGSVQRINEILEKGKLSEIKLKSQNKKEMEYIEELEKVINIGRKKAIELVREKNIKSIEDLKKAIKTNKIEVNDKILLGLKYFDKFKQNIPRQEIVETEMFLKSEIKKIDPELFLIICGSFRRLKLTSNDIDVLITHPKVKTFEDKEKNTNYLAKFITHLKKINFLKDDLTDKNYITKYMGFSKYKNNPIRRIDIRYVAYESYYPALLYFTGSGNFNKKMREIAISLGYKLNEYGLYKIVEETDRFGNTVKQEKMVKVDSEKDIFDKLGMDYLDPKDRI